MLYRGVQLPDGSLLLATVLFVLSVGLAEELFFRGIGLYYLRQAFSNRNAILISSVIFGVGHVAAILANPSLTLVVLSIINATLYGFFAASWAVKNQSIYYLMIHHALFNLVDYVHRLSGNELILSYAVRGALLLVMGWYYFKHTD